MPPRIHMQRAEIGVRSDIFQSPLGETLAHLVDVEAEFAGAQALALVRFVGDARARPSARRGVGALDDHDAVVVGDDHVARLDIGAGANDRHVARTRASP